jgi:hypothetical protein
MKNENNLEQLLNIPNIIESARADLFVNIIKNNLTNEEIISSISEDFLTNMFNIYANSPMSNGQIYIPEEIVSITKVNQYTTLQRRNVEIMEFNLNLKSEEILKTLREKIDTESIGNLFRRMGNFENNFFQSYINFFQINYNIREKLGTKNDKLQIKKNHLSESNYYFSAFEILKTKIHDAVSKDSNFIETFKPILTTIYINTSSFLYNEKRFTELLELCNDSLSSKLEKNEINQLKDYALLILDSENNLDVKTIFEGLKNKNPNKVSYLAKRAFDNGDLSYDKAIKYVNKRELLILNLENKRDLENTFQTLDSILRSITSKVNERDDQFGDGYSNMSDDAFKYYISKSYIKKLAILSHSLGLKEISKKYLSELYENRFANKGIKIKEHNFRIAKDEHLYSNFNILIDAYFETQNYEEFFKCTIEFYETINFTDNQDYSRIKNILNNYKSGNIQELIKIRNDLINKENPNLKYAICVSSLISKIDDTKKDELFRLEEIYKLSNYSSDHMRKVHEIVSSLFEKKDKVDYINS